MAQQIRVTGAIASSIGRIATGTEKSRGEIGDAIGRLDALEAMSRALLDRQEATRWPWRSPACRPIAPPGSAGWPRSSSAPCPIPG
ncbi:hypothetical protein [uncultured Methylobacterium sp.]|uniref:hypothetical protein n=1 Tax=uncultured Methylobacterium sp. TaxID=157278 RepID=UPI0035CC2FA0